MRSVGYVSKVKDSFEPDSNQRPKDVTYASTVLRSTTELSKERLRNYVFIGKTLFHAKPMNL